MPLDAMFECGSMTKQFTAVAVLQLKLGRSRPGLRLVPAEHADLPQRPRLIDSPNQRVLVIFGSGHLRWLRHNLATDPDIHLRKLAEFAVPERREPTGGMAR